MPVNRNRRLQKHINMSLGLVGRKVGMTRIFAEDGASIPVTVLDMSANRVTQIKTAEVDGYSAVQVTFGARKASRVNKAAAGHFAKANVSPGEALHEFGRRILGNVEFLPPRHAIEDGARLLDRHEVEVDAVGLNLARVERLHAVVKVVGKCRAGDFGEGGKDIEMRAKRDTFRVSRNLAAGPAEKRRRSRAPARTGTPTATTTTTTPAKEIYIHL